MTHPLVPCALDHPIDDHAGVEPATGSDHVISFPDGLPGFESCRRFALLAVEGVDAFNCLQSLDPSGPSFLVIDPTRVLQGYRTILNRWDRVRLGVIGDDALLWLAIITFGPDDEAWVNLRAPVVINPMTMIGFQVMPHQSLYPIRHPLNL
jgi:flagellar assembly factor FliW